MIKTFRSSILIKLGCLYFLMALLTVASILYTVHTFRILKDVGRAMDIAGSERMRSILLGFLIHEYVEEVRKNPGAQNARAVKLSALLMEELKTYRVFLDGLIAGNSALGLEKTRGDEALMDQLAILKQEFLEWEKNILRALRPEIKLADLEKIQKQLSVENALRLKETAHKAVTLLEGQFQKNVQDLKDIEKVIMAASIALSFFSIWLIYLIIRPIKDVVLITNKMAEGNLAESVEVDLRDEIGVLGAAINHTISEWNKILRQLTDGSEKLSLSSANISLAASEIAQGAKEQVEQVIQTSEAMEQMSHSIQEVSKNAQTTANYAEMASHKLQQGKSTCGKTVETIRRANQKMDELNKESAEIGKIVHFINDFAEQTNLLSINAAIEAERAGIHGKGFDVVADEIRKLARKTSKFTTDIIMVLENIQQDLQNITKIMNEGTGLVEDTGNFLAAITEDISRTAERVSLISSATSHQVDISGKIADSLFLISGVSRETSNNSRDSVEETQKLAALAEDLRNITKKFRINGNF